MVYYIENENLKVGVKTAGAELTSVVSKDSGYEFLWQGNTDIWYGQSPVLFPIIGRLLDDKYFVDGKEYSMPKHGLFRKREAELFSHTDSSMTFVERDDDVTIEKYPYKFEIYVTFEVVGKALKVTHKIVNINDKTMYFSIGAHPAFNCAIGDTLTFDENETLATTSIDSDSIRVNETKPVLDNEKTIVITKDIFNDDALILSGIKSENVTLDVSAENKKIKFNMGKSPYLGIWAKPGAPYVCIEPWWGVNDSRERKSDFSQKDGIQSLEAGKIFKCAWTADFIE